MRVPGFPGAHLTYCLNIHPGETWAENLAAIRRHACRVRELVLPRGRFGLGLRISRRAAGSLSSPARLREFRQVLSDLGMYAFTVNGFPYGTFHARPCKAAVYRPDWRHRARLEYTRGLAEILAAVLPDGLDGSVSTVPVAYRGLPPRPVRLCAAVENIASCAAFLHELKGRTGREIHLGLEPEPDCVLETTAGTLEFFERRLLPAGAPAVARRLGCSTDEAETILRRHVGVCFDTCHFSVQFDRLEPSLTRLARSGIRISKVQLSAALKAGATADSARRLAAFVDPVYLHQAKTLDARGTKRSHPDLTGRLLSSWTGRADAEECRIHFHVPLYVSEYDGIASTAGDLTPSFLASAVLAGARHFEIETYTFGVLPPALRLRAVELSIAAEYKWALAQFRRAAG